MYKNIDFLYLRIKELKNITALFTILAQPVLVKK